MKNLACSAIVCLLVNCEMSIPSCCAEPRPVNEVRFYSPSVARQTVFSIILPKGYGALTITFAQAPGAHTTEYGTRAVRDTISHQYAVMMKHLGGH